MDIQNMSEIRRPASDFRNDKLRQQLSKIEMPAPKLRRHFSFSKKSIYVTAFILAIILVVCFLIIFIPQSGKYNGKWQAVFLANNQVYFGKVVQSNKYEIILRDIYYLQDPAILQQGSVSELNKTTLDFKIIKLGKEIHGPEDEMQINRGQVLFIENLRLDSKVVMAIEDYIKNKQK